MLTNTKRYPAPCLPPAPRAEMRTSDAYGEGESPSMRDLLRQVEAERERRRGCRVEARVSVELCLRMQASVVVYAD